MVTQYKNTLQILIKYKYLIIKLLQKKTKIIEAYCHQMYHLLVYNTSKLKPSMPYLYSNNPCIFKGLYNCVTTFT